jgi:RNA polymerase sigma-70 factor (ECF subfamily)
MRVVPRPQNTLEFAAAVEPHRRELLVHCYQMLGSVQEAQDLLQETMLRAWQAYERYDSALASMRTWLYRIATNACLNALESRARRPLPSGVGPPFDDPDGVFVPGFEVPWLQPIPDGLLGSIPDDPATLAVERSGLRLALVAAMQLLPAKQRATLILRDVLGFSAAEVGDILGVSTGAVTSALQRARATLAGPSLHADLLHEPEPEQREIVDRYMAAFERADIESIVRMLAEQVILEMPPMRNWFVGPVAYSRFMSRVFYTRGNDWRTVPISANRQPGMVAYARQADHYQLHTLQIFTVERGAVVRTTVYQSPEVFAIFDLPEMLIEGD